MRRSCIGALAVLAVGLGLLASREGPACAAEVAFAGTWKVTLVAGAQEVQPWLVKFEGMDSKPKGTLVSAAPKFKDATVEDVKLAGSALRFAIQTKNGLSFRIVAYLPKAKGKPKQILGTLAQGEQVLPLRLEPSDLKKIDPDGAKPIEGLAEAKAAFSEKDKKQRDKQLLALITKYAGKPTGFVLAEVMVRVKGEENATGAELKPLAEQYVKASAPYGRELTLSAHHTTAQFLAENDKASALALEHAQKAAALFNDTDSGVMGTAVLKNLAGLLKKAGKDGEAKAIEGRVAKFAAKLNVENLERARAAVKGLSKEAPARQRLQLLKNLATALRKAGKADEAKTTDAQVNRENLEVARAAVKRLGKDDPPRERMVVLKRLAAALRTAGKADEAKTVDSQVAKVLAEVNKEVLEGIQKAYKEIDADTPPSSRESTLKKLASALKKTGKAEEAKKYDAEAAKLTAKLDKEFAKNAVPFKTEAFAGRKGKSGRVVLVELFTGAQCPPCVSADIAFDAVLKSFKPSEVVLLQYHLHVPGPDPLTNADSVARAEYYGEDVKGTPSSFVDGDVIQLGGYKKHGEERYQKLRKRVAGQLEEAAGAKVKLVVTRKGNKIDVKADVTDIEKASNAHLRFALIEDVVHYAGGNKQRLHHHVVRALPGGAAGIAIKGKAGSGSASVDLTELRKGLLEYLTESNEEREFPNEDRPLELKKLKVVAFVQDDTSKQVLQAVQADVPEGK